MPRLNGIKDDFYNGRKVDKESEDVAYFDNTHEYLDKKSGKKGISVTTLIHSYSNPFDADFWSSYKALEEIMDLETWIPVKKALLATKKFDSRYLTKFKINEEEFQKKKKEILASYDKKRDDACENGTKKHAELEQELYDLDPSIKRYKFGGNLSVFKGDYKKVLTDGIYPEYLISYKDPEIFLCGQIDLLCVENSKISVLDHKTNSKIDMKSYYNKSTRSYQMLKYPLNNIMDCNGQIYTLQLSTYAWMVQQSNPSFDVKRLVIHWIDHDGNESFIDVPYLKDDVEKMIADYKKKSKNESAYAALKNPLL